MKCWLQNTGRMTNAVVLMLIFSVGYNLNYNNYTWLRAPMLKNDINLDNHNVKIEEYTFTYKSDGNNINGISNLSIGLVLQASLPEVKEAFSSKVISFILLMYNSSSLFIVASLEPA